MVTPQADDIQQTRTRLYSLDALRGFDMFWIMGGDELFHALHDACPNSAILKALSDQLEHPLWNGFHLYDLIFPLFLFMAGVSTSFSVGRDLEKGKTRQELLWKVIKRGLILVLFGIIVNNGLQIKPLAEIRFPSVLGRIGIAYMIANIIYLYSKEIAQMIWFWVFIVGYWLLLKFTSAPGHPAGDLTPEGNFASYIDRTILPGHLYVPFPDGRPNMHDPEGLFSTIPAISTGLLGILTGTLLKKTQFTQMQKVWRMVIVGLIFIGLSLLWNLDFPINKNLWSSSFVLLVGGLSLLYLSLFYYVIDVLGYQKWAFFFKVIGMNSILIYMSGHFINWTYLANGFFKWLVQLAAYGGEHWGYVMLAICVLVVKWFFLYFMYKKKVFLRV
jgi:predicted acyltransferase